MGEGRFEYPVHPALQARKSMEREYLLIIPFSSLKKSSNPRDLWPIRISPTGLVPYWI
jgi:hypothetical protein